VNVVERLAKAGCLDAAGEAQALVAASPDDATLDAWLRRRERGEPLPWITGAVAFAGRTLHIAPGVYVPRPQTEELARRAASLLPPGGRALDLCTGTGAVAAHLRAQVPSATVVAVDSDDRAAACARRNGVAVAVMDLADAIHAPAQLDLVTAVAPYVPTGALRLLPADVQRHEPASALHGGADGLGIVRRVIAAASLLLRPGGWVLVEVGGEQDAALITTWVEQGFECVTPWRDEEGDLRGVAARRASDLPGGA
jgi:release factor glutamine methyltransferase